MLYLYDTLTLEKQKFKPLRQEEVKVYFCGPTPYNFAHIGNLKTYVFEDYVIKTLRFLGYKVKTTMNITDIDDKTIRDSQKFWEKLLPYTQKYTKYFLEDLQKLNITLADNIAPISWLIDEMVEMIDGLIKRWYAYLWDDGSIYYDIKKFKSYGKLAHLNFEGMKTSIRINNDEYDKENAADFALWKAWKEDDGENYWEREFDFDGEKKMLKGRPGWHIECSACNLKYFWAQIDIHMGWVDNIFPHHQNEIAQSEGYTGKTFAKYWLHGGHITVDGKKMSKSANNFYTLKDLEEKFAHIPKDILYRSIRLAFMNAKYRESVDFSFEKLEQNFNIISRIDESVKKLLRYQEKNDLKNTPFRRDLREDLQDFIGRYIESLEDDFNMPIALSIFFEYITFVNTHLGNGQLNADEAKALFDMYKNFNEVLSLIQFEFEDEAIPSEIVEIFEARNQAKSQKDFEKADLLRNKLWELGYKIIDEKWGSRVERV